MTNIIFEPSGVDAGWSFTLDGEPPEDRKTSPTIFWSVKVCEHGPRGTEVILATGGTLGKLLGHVSFEIGTATPEGRYLCHEDMGPQWGSLSYYNEPKEQFFLQMFVSRSMYETLKALVAARTLPTITVTVGSGWTGKCDDSGKPEPPNKDAIRRRSLPFDEIEWENGKFPHLETRWCTFNVDVGSPKSEDDDTQPGHGMMPPTRNDRERIENILGSLMLSVRKVELLAVPLWIAVFLLAILVYRGWR